VGKAVSIGLALVTLIATATATATAEPRIAAEPRTDQGLIWQAPASCPDAVEVRARIERRIGVPIERLVHGVTVEIAIDDERGGSGRFVARIDPSGITVVNGVRVLTSARCDELTDAVALVIARLTADARRAPPDLGVERPIAVAAPAAVVRHEWGGGVRMIGLSGVGALPRVGLGGELAAYVRRGELFVELAGAGWRRSTQVVHPGAPGRVDVHLQDAALRLGWGPEQLPIRTWIGAELGAIEGEGVALEEPHIGTAVWVSAAAGFGVAWPVMRRARVVGLVELAVPLDRPRFVLRTGSEVFRPEAVAARYGLGLEIGWR
jgi:hypothetical protein